MSRAYPRNQAEPLSLVPFDDDLLDEAASEAGSNPRKRSIVRLHEHGELLQRMLNAIEPESYARPHRHPDKPEAFVALRGSLLMVRYAESGTPLEGVVVSERGPVKGVEIPPGAWHSIVSLEPGTVIFEVTQGPYDPATHKVFAPWAPPEEDRGGGAQFIAHLRAHFAPLIPELDALNVIQAEEDEIC